MTRTVYVNGEFLFETEAKVSIFDRGFLFADGIYEVTAVLEEKLVGWDGHINRLKRSLSEIEMSMPEDESKILDIHRELIKRNRLSEGLVYMQITRGDTDRDFLIAGGLKPSLIMFTQEINLLDPIRLNRGLRIMTHDDIRWCRSDIKTIQLLASSLIKTDAISRGFDDAWLVRNGYVTEGTSSNAFIVNSDNEIITRNLSHEILSGVTRAAIIQSIDNLGLKLVQRPFSSTEAKLASEAFMTSASNFVVSVIEIDGVIIGDGAVGSTTKKLRDEYLTTLLKTSF